MVDLILSVLAICVLGMLVGLTIFALMEIVKYLRKIAQFLSVIARTVSNANCYMLTSSLTKTDKKELSKAFTSADAGTICCEEANKDE